MNVQEINKKMVGFFEDRLQQMGVLNSGLQNYYVKRIENKNILNSLDLYIINFITENYKNVCLHEIAGGACQVGHALSLLGHNVTASEIFSKRYNLAFDLGVFLNSGCKVIFGDSFKLNLLSKLYYTVNAASSNMDIERCFRFFYQKMDQGSDVIINSKLFGKVDVDTTRAVQLEHDFILLEGEK
jgi:hypothetical protein